MFVLLIFSFAHRVVCPPIYGFSVPQNTKGVLRIRKHQRGTQNPKTTKGYSESENTKGYSESENTKEANLKSDGDQLNTQQYIQTNQDTSTQQYMIRTLNIMIELFLFVFWQEVTSSLVFGLAYRGYRINILLK
jgi:hypothetical protein